MGLLIKGQWHDESLKANPHKGTFVRESSQFRNWITNPDKISDGEQHRFIAESQRYHLYVSYACPWAHRTLIFRALKQLENHISISVVHPHMLKHGWEFIPTHPHFNDPLNYCKRLYELYLLADPFYSGRVTVPVLWDKKHHTIVSNESAEIIRMFNDTFNSITGNRDDYYPDALRSEIDEINQFVYENINNGVYRVGFATEQAAYEQAFEQLFNALEKLEARLSTQPYLIGNQLTEADWRLFTTLIRFDLVYYGHFKCNLKHLSDYPNLYTLIKKLYHHPRIAQTVNFSQIKQHYYYSHAKINPTRIVPKGPLLTL